MFTTSDKPAPPAKPLDEILLGYLDQIWPWPGADGFTAEDVLSSYPRAVALGMVPDYPQLRRLYPNRIAELQELLEGRGWLKKCSR